jgi:hypothetical protein
MQGSVADHDVVAVESIRRLLRMVSFDRADEADELLTELDPVFVLDRVSVETKFWSRLGTPNIVGMGVRCSVRLQVQAHAAGVVFTALGCDLRSLTKKERDERFGVANDLLNWAVGVDFTRRLEALGVDLEPDHVLRRTDADVPHELRASLTPKQQTIGEGFFQFAVGFVLLHELGHLKLGHPYEEGLPSIEQEKEADRFAAEWMSRAASSSSGDVESDRLLALYGIVVALLWLTVTNVYFGQVESKTHPQAYDRLAQVLDHVVEWHDEEEFLLVWDFVTSMLLIHMDSAGYDFDDDDWRSMSEGDRRDAANLLIDRISRYERKRP